MVANKVVICKHFYIQPSELERMPFWEYEMTLKECEKLAEEEKKRQEEENKNSGGGYNQRNYQRQAERMMHNNSMRMPSMSGGFSMPKMPRI